MRGENTRSSKTLHWVTTIDSGCYHSFWLEESSIIYIFLSIGTDVFGFGVSWVVPLISDDGAAWSGSAPVTPYLSEHSRTKMVRPQSSLKVHWNGSFSCHIMIVFLRCFENSIACNSWNNRQAGAWIFVWCSFAVVSFSTMPKEMK